MVGTVSQSPLLQNQFLQFDFCLRRQQLTLVFAHICDDLLGTIYFVFPPLSGLSICREIVEDGKQVVAQIVCCPKVASHDPLLERERLKEIAIARITARWLM